ncbi:MAG: HEAT repeat domain-containing protein [Planctomycetia bacterium]|nr:HEAT repeat domain-containing protein [Planctomycetia bacterium]
MPFEPLFCDRCHESIPDADLECGKAVRLGGRVLHVACAFRRAMPGPGRALTFLLALAAGAGAGFAIVRVQALEAERRAAPKVVSADDLARQLDALDGRIRATFDANRAATAEQVKALGLDLRDANVKSLDAATASLRAELQRQADATVSRFEANEQQLASIKEWVGEVRARAAALAQPRPAESAAVPPAPVPAPAPPTPPAVEPPGPQVAPPAPGRPAVDPEAQARIDDELARLLKMLKDPDPSRSFSATYKLKELKDLRASPALVETLLKHKDYYTRLGAATALGELKSCDAVPALIDALDDKDELVRVAAGEAIATIRGEATKPLVGLSKKELRTVKDDLSRWWKENEGAVRTRLAQPQPKAP